MPKDDDTNSGFELSPEQMAMIAQIIKGAPPPNTRQEQSTPKQQEQKATRRGRDSRSFVYRDLTFFVSFEGDLALVSVKDPKTKQPSLRARVRRESYMKAVHAIAKSVLADLEIGQLESATDKKS